MNRKILIAISWTAFIVLIVRIGWTSQIFENRALNMTYEVGFTLAGAGLIVLAFVALGKFLPKRSLVLNWLLIVLLIAAAAMLKSTADDHFDEDPPTPPDQEVRLLR